MGIVPKRSIGVTIFAYWFMFCGLMSISAAFLVRDRIDGIDTGVSGLIFVLQDISYFIIGFFVLKQKEWARKGIIVLTAAGLLLTMMYSTVPYFRSSIEKNEMKEKRHRIALEHSYIERMEIESVDSSSAYGREQARKMMEKVERRTQRMEHSPSLIFIPLIVSLLWFLFVFFYFTRLRVKEQFTRDPDIGRGGRFLIRYLGIIGFVLLFWNIYVIQTNPGHLFASRGIAYRNMGQWQQALDNYNKAIWFDHGNKELYLRRGYVQEKMGRKDKALKDYDRALYIDPFYSQALINRSLIRFDQKLYELALSDDYLVVTHDPNNYDGQITIGCVYENLQRPLSAIIHFRKAVELKPQDPQGYIARGKNYSDIGQKEKALEDFNKAIALDSHNADAYRKRSDYWFSMNDYLKAAQDQEMAFQLAPANADSLEWSIYFYYRIADMAKVKALYARAIKAGISLKQRTPGFDDLIVSQSQDGMVKGLDRESGLLYDRTFKNGFLEGPAHDFDAHGNLIKEFEFSHGLINGKMKIYNNGKLDEEWTYKNDTLHGITKQYFPNGEIKCTWMYANDKANGPASCYNANGDLQWDGNFKNGFRDGIQKTYHPGGSIWTQENYTLGEVSSPQKHLDKP